LPLSRPLPPVVPARPPRRPSAPRSRRMTMRPRSLAALAALVATACTVGPDYQRPAAIVPAAYKEDGWKVGAPQDALDRGAWWSVYGDSILDDLERQV